MISLLRQFAANSSRVNIPGNQCSGTCSDTVLYIVIAALQLITSGGNPESAKKARETIIYAVIGLIVAVSAEAIVTFFLNNL